MLICGPLSVSHPLSSWLHNSLQEANSVQPAYSGKSKIVKAHAKYEKSVKMGKNISYIWETSAELREEKNPPSRKLNAIIFSDSYF